jgi:single-stranded DNA-specific DHH superfamily exonuclease
LTVVYAAQSEAPRKTSRTALLPLLIVLFLVSYAILAMLVLEQGRTIESQRGLLREMLRDSNQLAALKSKLANAEAKRSQDKAAAEAEQKEPDSGNSVAVPKGTDKDAKRPGKSARTLKETPQKPAADLEDVRRSTRVI